MNTAKMA